MVNNDQVKDSQNSNYLDNVEGNTSSTLDDVQTTKIKQTQIKEASWYLFVQSFLELCESGLKELKQDDGLNKAYLVISLLYNVKHAIEIILKCFVRMGNDKLDRSDGTHDIKALLDNFKKQFSKGKKPDNKIIESIEALEELVIKYYSLDVLNKKADGCYSIQDTENTFLKYPENSVRVTVDYPLLISKITKSDILNIGNDLSNLRNIVEELKSVIKVK